MKINSDLLHNVDAERAVLGSCLFSSEALGIALELLKPDDFFDSMHRTAFEVISSLWSRDIPVDYVTFSDELRKRKIFDRMGGVAFVNQLVDGINSTANTEYYASIIRDNSIRRKLSQAGDRISQLASNKTVDIDFQLVEKLIAEAGQNKGISAEPISVIARKVLDNVEALMDNGGGRVTGYRTGFDDLDTITGGLQRGSLNIVAARPSMGKTALALNIAQFGGDNRPVLIFSLEMPATQLALRMIAADSGINLSALSRGLLSTEDYTEVAKACGRLAASNILINDQTNASAIDLRSKARQFKASHPNLALIVVDYLQLMTSGLTNYGTNRNLELSDVSRTLKAVARECDCPVLALSQLSREVEKRTDKMPQLSDLRDSGAIEQDADLVMMLYREDYYSRHENSDLTDSRADIRIAKNRNGATGMISLTFQREITRFRDFGHE